ncbi:DUF6414 family protein [Flavobacterium anhuiense]|uniref:DUF6414 family protein n=1 Tax=Flavobacterium anhuiense TaxID=459526 RepID=UPI00202753E4|nr:hypothetical protein [Flavobacterium anhuiense]URM36528.1 hypothetical protein LLY39_19255 [Flavobacterium anhuiense]
MKKLRSFLYLDNYKMYSISSQLFEGLTEQIIKSENNSKIEQESQKGPFSSGKMLADIIETNTTQKETKFLHDFSYNLFEDSLFEQNKVLEINSSNIKESLPLIENFSFVKISGNTIFNDLKIIEDTITNFNKIGEALGYLTLKSKHDEEVAELKNSIKNIQDRNKKASANAMIKSTTDFKKYIKEAGLNMDNDFIKHLAYVLDYGYNQQFEVQIPINSEDEFRLFSAQLNRDNLKENEYSIIKKYSRESEREFKLFGILTQKLTAESKNSLFKELRKEKTEDSSIKEALMNMVEALTNVENTFTGKLDYEYIIDPIALYLEI